MRKILHFLAKTDLTCQVIFVTKVKVEEGTDVTLQYMDLTDESIEEVISNCRKFVADRENWDYEEYGKNRDEKLERKYNVETTDAIPNVKEYLKKAHFKAESLDDPELVKNLKFIQFRIESRDKTVIFVRKFTQQRILSHGKKIWKEISGTLGLAKDKIAEIPEDYDFCKYGENVAVFDPANFEDFFDYHGIHEKYHKTVFTYLMKKIDYEIIDLDKYMEQTLEHPRKLRKLPAIMEKQMYVWTFDQIQKFLKERPVPTIKLDNKKRTMEFRDVFAMMDFFNDAHLDSHATNRHYRVQDKAIE